MAGDDKKADGGQAIDALQAELAKLRADNEALQAEIAKLMSARPPTKAELEEKRKAAEEKALQARAKRDAESQDLVTIQKFNKAGDLIRERVCAKVDVPAYEKQGYKPVKD